MILNNKNQNRKTIIQSSQPINIYGMKYNRNNDVNMQREQDKMNNVANKNRQTIKINKRSSINRRSIGMLLRNNSPKYVGNNNFNFMQPSPKRRSNNYSLINNDMQSSPRKSHNPQLKNKRMTNNNNNSSLAKNVLRKSVMNKNSVRVSKVLPQKYEARASILDIYGGLSKYFPVKENDEVAKKARETGNRMSMMLEKVEKKLQRLSFERLSPTKNFEAVVEEPETTEEDKDKKQTEVSRSPLSSKSNVSEHNDKIDDILINNLITSNNKRGTIKPTKANVYKIVIKSQESEKLMRARKGAQKQKVVKKSVANIEFNKDKINSSPLSPEKSGMKSSPLREDITPESRSTSNPPPKPKPVPIKTKINTLQKMAASLSASPISANSSKSSPNSSSVRSSSPISAAQQRKLADIESGNMSEELKHRTSHIIHIKSPSITINPNVPQDENSIVLVSPSTIVHTTLPIQKSDIKDETNNKTLTEADDTKSVDDNEQDYGILDENDNDPFNIRPGHWITGKLIGQGSYGKVFYAMNEDNGHIFAVKQVDIKNKVMVDSLNAEIDLLTGLKHENIVVYYGINLFI